MIVIGTPHTHNAGYYRNDDRPSGGKLAEDDVQTCTHCQAVIKMRKWKDDGAWCGRCEAPICTACAPRLLTHGCEPFLKQLELHVERQIRRRQYEKLTGL